MSFLQTTWTLRPGEEASAGMWCRCTRTSPTLFQTASASLQVSSFQHCHLGSTPRCCLAAGCIARLQSQLRPEDPPTDRRSFSAGSSKVYFLLPQGWGIFFASRLDQPSWAAGKGSVHRLQPLRSAPDRCTGSAALRLSPASAQHASQLSVVHCPLAGGRAHPQRRHRRRPSVGVTACTKAAFRQPVTPAAGTHGG